MPFPPVSRVTSAGFGEGEGVQPADEDIDEPAVPVRRKPIDPVRQRGRELGDADLEVHRVDVLAHQAVRLGVGEDGVGPPQDPTARAVHPLAGARVGISHRPRDQTTEPEVDHLGDEAPPGAGRIGSAALLVPVGDPVDRGADGVEVVTASGAGTPYAPLLRSLATGLQAQVQQQAGAAAAAAAQARGADQAQVQAAQAQARAAAADSVTVTDIAPLPAGDANGVGLAALALPLVFGGMATAALVSIVLRTAPWKRAVAALVIAALGSLAATVALHSWFDAVAGGFWLIWAGLTAGIAAISLTLIGLHVVAGYAGLALGAVTMMFVSNPLAGLATGPQWLPRGWGAFGQELPVGATGTWLRSAAYFDGRGMGGAPWVLLAWAVAGLVLLGIGAWRGRTGAAAPTAGPEAVAEGAGA